MKHQTSLRIFSGSSHPELANAIAKKLGVTVSPMILKRFACGEIYARVEESVRGADVFIVQTSTADVNQDLMELFIMIDSLKRSFAGRVHVVMPHFAYARQDRVAIYREPISAKLVANLIEAAGADHVITIHLHSDQEQGFFNFPIDNLHAKKIFVDYFLGKKLKNLVVVSPDAGGAKEAKKFADALGAELAIIHKQRPEHNRAEVMNVVGDVTGKTCVLYDDMIDTAGSVTAAIVALKKYGANKDVYLAATHAVFSEPAVERLAVAGFKEVVVTDTIPVPASKKFTGLKVLSVAPLLASIIKNVHDDKSVTKEL